MSVENVHCASIAPKRQAAAHCNDTNKQHWWRWAKQSHAVHKPGVTVVVVKPSSKAALPKQPTNTGSKIPLAAAVAQQIQDCLIAAVKNVKILVREGGKRLAGGAGATLGVAAQLCRLGQYVRDRTAFAFTYPPELNKWPKIFPVALRTGALGDGSPDTAPKF